MKIIDLERILNGDIEHISNINIYEQHDPNLEVTISPWHVKKMLLAYLDESISAEQLNAWAEFICFKGSEYVCENWENDESADFYEDMRYVVQKLSTPEIDGEITPETVRNYLNELDKYFKNDSSSANDS